MQTTQIIKEKNENLEILRAIAIIFVLIVHSRIILLFPSSTYEAISSVFDGNVGVDLFFVISGFVIAKTLNKYRRHDKAMQIYLIMVFWIKRIFRILPVALLWLCVAIFFIWFTGNFWDGHHLKLNNLIPIAAAIFNVFNIFNAYCVANPNDMTLCNTFYFFFGHYWSLSLEAQFYLIFPFLLFFLKKRSLALLLVMTIVSFIFWCRPYWTYGWFFRIDGFCWGILLSLLPQRDVNKLGLYKIIENRKIALMFFWSLTFLLPFLSTLVQGFGEDTKTYGISLMAAISAVLVFIAVSKKDLFDDRPMFRKVMLYIGSRSYSIYVSHLMIFCFMTFAWKKIIGNMQASNILGSLINLSIVVFAIMIVFSASEMTYKFIEVKFRLKGRKIAEDLLQHRR